MCCMFVLLDSVALQIDQTPQAPLATQDPPCARFVDIVHFTYLRILKSLISAVGCNIKVHYVEEIPLNSLLITV